VDDAGGERVYQRVDSREWSAHELSHGKRIKLRRFPKDHTVQLFRIEVSTHRTDYVVTNDPRLWLRFSRLGQAQRTRDVDGPHGLSLLKHGLLDDYLIQQLLLLNQR
jgi:hypothetical protein